MLAVGALVVAGGTAVALRDPHVAGSWGVCPSSLVGLQCPGCGGLRAAYDLTRLDLAGAAGHHLLLVVALPPMLLGWAWLLVAALRARRVRRPGTAAWVAAAVLMATFTLARNLPGSWLAA